MAASDRKVLPGSLSNVLGRGGAVQEISHAQARKTDPPLTRRALSVYRNRRGVVGGEASYSEARMEAERIISEARHGRDPFIGVALLRNADISTFEGLCERFLADPAPGRKGRVLSEVTRVGITRIIRKELIPAWGYREPNSIQRPEIQHWAKAIADGKGRVKGAPRSRAHYDMYHYVPEKRDALTRWVQRLTEILGYDPNDVMKAERIGYQGRGQARKLGKRESYPDRKARLAAQGRDLAAERRERRQAKRSRLVTAS